MVHIELYTKAECPLCETAKRMLQEAHVTFTEIMLGVDIDRETLLKRFPGAKKVPIIVADGVQVKDPENFKLLLEG